MIQKYEYKVIEAKDMSLGVTRYILQISIHGISGCTDNQYLLFHEKEAAEKFGKLSVGLLENAELKILRQVAKRIDGGSDE